MTGERFLIISGHDFRTKRKASVHFIAQSLRKLGEVCFYSIGFSHVSRAKKDHRVELWPQANTVCESDGVRCFLERSLVHPFRTKLDWLSVPEALWFQAYAKRPRTQFWDWVGSATTIIFESGMSILFAEQVARANPTARKIYLASDDLKTIGCADYLIRCLDRSAAHLEYAVLTSKILAGAMPPKLKLVYVPHGFDQTPFLSDSESPYADPINAVSVGPTLFDESFFQIACDQFPEVTFHIIGAGRRSSKVTAPNAVIRQEMPFADTIPYVKHASVGIAPYANKGAPYYLSDTSLKLAQYEFVGLNAVCPFFACGHKPGRFGYDPGNASSIFNALSQALSKPKSRPDPSEFLDWESVTNRCLAPERFPDTRM
jgi:2-beta-glucuronyltransferase